ncbi:VacJ family lipoprotein [Nitrosomonas sp. JL21]|uniref:MlaA family lipoprotein n=1 Tax=Nitrosomonas sp. JL21 TaxID=153949 RepID=UPI00136F013D|nr:VacJ family lipoprotein [Nitrosomonas sp. JL21]MBL8496946.1 VacJ family lipoprotein [Nitrosomonas sp.]MXS78519.1 VacJ family lipoprotein [Nitrosomonas sp. JL21]
MINFIRYKAAVLVCCLLLIGCASTATKNQNGPNDPLEPMNRAVFNFNEMVDNNVLEPAARGYKWVMPDPLELVVGNFFSNLNDVVVLGNSILQLNYESALASGARIFVNTTFGLFGLIDIASDISAASDVNLNKRNEDFGQTLGRYGVASGPYIVLPFLGPSSIRDTFGIAVDSFFMDPVTQGVTGVFLKNVSYLNSVSLRLPVATARTLHTRAQWLDTEKTVDEAALDKYEFMRDAYIQRRISLINNSDTPETK